MSDDDFGTISVRRGERAREIEVMRQHYRKHRESLLQMAADAPTESLAEEYQRLVGSIDQSLVKLDELERRPASAAVTQHQQQAVPPPPPMSSAMPPAPVVAPPMARPMDDLELTQPHYQVPEDDPYAATPGGRPGNSRAPIIGIVLAGLVVLGVIAWLLLRSMDKERPAIVEQTATTETATETETAPPADTAPPAAAGALTIRPATIDYGVLRKGTRASRQYEVTNNGENPVTIQVARSTCRCLYYEYEALVPPKGKETITITIDGARAPAGALREALAVTAKNAPEVRGELVVQARIQ
ncbi:MAG TPA: DUF1573 domain-containing protein [Thermoanaerobaculia bacterium]|jgi:hypothetical protein